MTKRYFILFYLLMIALGAYLLADTVNLFIGSHLEAAVEPPPKPFQKGSPRSTVEYQTIVEGNIFDASLRGKHPVEEKGIAPAVAAVPLSPLNLTLIGTVVGPGKRYAVIEDGKTHVQTLYHLGDQIGEEPQGAQGQPEGKIIRIARNEVVILRQGQREVLTTSLNGDSKPVAIVPQPIQPAAPASGSSIRQVAEGKWVLDRREVESAVENLPQLLTKARVIPNFTNGKPDGFKIFAIDTTSLYAKIGLQNGDVIQRINGIEMRDPQNFMRVFQQLKDEPNITIDLVRNNQKETFGYEIR
ncbi:MAG TPA: type II secretion system protein GspC [Nitrospiria bacterium]|nr:type II secretion system protein GspC [Nitrospiria bacterium]